MQRARLRIENEPSRGIREIKLHSLKRVKFPRYLEMGPNVTDWNCLLEQGMFKSNAWISWIFFRFGYDARKEGDFEFKNHRRESEFGSSRLDFSLEAGKNTISLPENDFKERAKRNRCRESERWDEEEGAAKCLSNPIFFRLVRYPFTRGEFDPVENYRDSYLGSNDNEPRSFFSYVIARPMTFSLRKWLQRSLRYETIRLRQLFQQRYVAVLRPSRENGFESAKFIIGEGIRRNALCFA